MSSEPKPCPFCGSKAKKHKYTMLGEDFKVAYCPNEDCYFHHRTASVADWNTRPIEDALDKRIAELEAMVEKLNGWIDELINAGNQPRHRNWQDNWDAIVYRIIKEREE